MNTRFFWISGMALIQTVSMLGQSKRARLDGVWQVAEVTFTGPAGHQTAKAGPNLTILSGRHYSRIEVHTDRPRPVLKDVDNATADQLRQAWGPFVAEAGTYEYTDDLITMQPMVAKNPAAMGPGVSIVYS